MPASPRAQKVAKESDLIINTICDFVQHHSQKMLDAMDQNGDWEGWAQVELAFWLTEGGSEYYFCAREEKVFKDSAQKIDIWAEHNGYSAIGGPSVDADYPQNGEPVVGIELKCHGPPQDTEYGDFQNRISKHIMKIVGGLKPECTRPNGARVYAIGLTSDESALRDYDDIARSGMQVYYSEVDVKNTSKVRFIVWWAKNFPKA